jgi:hypothetical protein
MFYSATSLMSHRKPEASPSVACTETMESKLQVKYLVIQPCGKCLVELVLCRRFECWILSLFERLRRLCVFRVIRRDSVLT